MEREVRMPHRENALVEPMQPPAFGRLLNRPMGVSEPPKLPNRDHSVLATSKRSKFLPSRQRFCTHEVEKLCRAGFLPRWGLIRLGYPEVPGAVASRRARPTCSIVTTPLRR